MWGSQPLYQRADGLFYYYVDDRIGTPIALIESSGAIAWSANYEAFGKAHVGAGVSVQNPLRGSAQYEDDETGFHYNTFRYYHPTLGRYLQRDPLEAIPGYVAENNMRTGFNPLLITDDPNAYQYVRNSPVNDADLFGLFGGGTKPAKGKEGNATPYKGHSDFAGFGETCDTFDWNLEDDSWWSKPTPTWWDVARGLGTAGAALLIPGVGWGYAVGAGASVLGSRFIYGESRHFRNKEAIFSDLDGAIKKCEKVKFERYMHQWQDTFVHYEGGYRWYKLGHGVVSGEKWLGDQVHKDWGKDPDNNDEAWTNANRDTMGFLGDWNRNCCHCCKAGDCCSWVPRKDAQKKCGGCR